MNVPGDRVVVVVDTGVGVGDTVGFVVVSSRHVATSFGTQTPTAGSKMELPGQVIT